MHQERARKRPSAAILTALLGSRYEILHVAHFQRNRLRCKADAATISPHLSCRLSRFSQEHLCSSQWIHAYEYGHHKARAFCIQRTTLCSSRPVVASCRVCEFILQSSRARLQRHSASMKGGLLSRPPQTRAQTFVAAVSGRIPLTTITPRSRYVFDNFMWASGTNLADFHGLQQGSPP